MGSREQEADQLTWDNISHTMVLTKEVTKGEFDPRTYREADPANWARKRRSDWLAVPGKIVFTRERTVDREMEDGKKPEPEPSPEREVMKVPPWRSRYRPTWVGSRAWSWPGRGRCGATSRGLGSSDRRKTTSTTSFCPVSLSSLYYALMGYLDTAMATNHLALYSFLYSRNLHPILFY